MKAVFTRQEIRNTMAREIRYTRSKRAFYLKTAGVQQDAQYQEMYSRSAAACSASIDGIRSLAKRLGLIEERQDDIRF